MMEVEQLYEILRKVQEPKGYFFNKEALAKVFSCGSGMADKFASRAKP